MFATFSGFWLLRMCVCVCVCGGGEGGVNLFYEVEVLKILREMISADVKANKNNKK